MSLVIDASITLAWYFEDEGTAETDAVLDQVVAGGALVPGLWKLEVANGLQTAIRRNRCDTAFRTRALSELGCLAIAIDPETNTHAWSDTLHLADLFRLSAYDAAYLELAQRQHLALATLDRPLRSAATALGLAVAPTAC